MTKKERQDLLSRILAEPNPRKARLSAANIAKKSPDLSRKHSSSSAESKKNYARKDAILIDDRISNINDWNNAGGIGILHTSTSSTLTKLSKYGL